MAQKFATLVLILIFLCFLSVPCQATDLRPHHYHHRHRGRGSYPRGVHPSSLPQKLFVFGDSYADSGNNPKGLSSSWKVPYGTTFPGKPSGRFSDGRVLPDFVGKLNLPLCFLVRFSHSMLRFLNVLEAKYYGLRSPTPYKFRESAPEHARRYGINFAFGGTGVFETLVALPNMTAQIDIFQQVIGEGTYTVADLRSSLALVQLSGNDYSAFLLRNGSFEALPAFIQSVVNQLTINIKRIHGLGIEKVAVSSLPPLGCLPSFTSFLSPRKCNDFINPFVQTHNNLLAGSMALLNNETGTSTFTVINLHDSFTVALGNSTFNKPLEPCCIGINGTYKCGDVDPSRTKMYQVCPRPDSRFFWDMVHPTQQGWKVVFSSLEPAFQHL
ncbi:hypothetical protein MLD38_035509 [Melastoma candidum]|uniref:Uncharacterized protein n=1 Tax=Melastoma candidum TaxID=119954 RepID=A0ACB9LH84_9MYRT|nr:hypothetical protein MLD38_035509 [Melastoma candidum]